MTLGPALILALVGVLWLDGVLDRTQITGWLSTLFGGRATLPPGMAILACSLALSPLASNELTHILRHNGVPASRRIMWTASAIGIVVSCTIPETLNATHAIGLVSTLAVFVLLLSLLYHARHREAKGAAAAAGGALLSFVYLGLLFGFILAIRRHHSEWLVLVLLLITKSCDIGAFFTGITLGRRKLIPWLSPGKTWEGLIGGVLLATLLGLLAARYSHLNPLDPPFALWEGALLGAVLALVGQAGDLIESLFKRDAGVKDSSTAIPGFGGLLDVIDSPLLAAPAAFWLLALFHAT